MVGGGVLGKGFALILCVSKAERILEVELFAFLIRRTFN